MLRLLVFAVALLGSIAAVYAECSGGFNFTCPTGHFINGIKGYVQNGGYTLLGLSCTGGTTYGNYSATIPVNVSLSMDEQGSGKYWMVGLETVQATCANQVLSFQLSQYDASGYYSQRTYTTQTYPSWRTTSCSSQPSQQYVNSISAIATSPFLAGVTVSCTDPYAWTPFPNPVLVRAYGATTITPKIFQYTSKRVGDNGTVWTLGGDPTTASQFGYFAMNGVMASTCTQADINNGNLTFVAVGQTGDGGYYSPNPRYPNGPVQTYIYTPVSTSKYFGGSIRDGSQYYVPYLSISIKLNWAPTVATPAALLTAQNQPVLLDTAFLRATDQEESSDNLLWAVTDSSFRRTGSIFVLPPDLSSNAVILGDGATFRQTDVSAGKIYFVPVASFTGSFSLALSVTDGVKPVPVTLQGVIATPNWASKPVRWVWPKGTAPKILGLSSLANPDPSGNLTEIKCTIKALDSVVLSVLTSTGWMPLAVGDEFAFSKVAFRQIQIGVPSGFVGNASFTYNVIGTSQPGSDPTSGTIQIVSDGPPTITLKTITAPQVSNRIIVNSTYFLASDVETWDPAAIRMSPYAYSSAIGMNLQIFRNGQWASAYFTGITFSQADFNAGNIGIVFDSSQTGYGYFEMFVSDGVNPAVIARLPVNHVAAPRVTLTGLTISFNGSVTLSPTYVSATSSYAAAASLVYTVTKLPASGTLLNGNVSLAVSSQFKQDDIQNGRLQYTTSASYNGSTTLGLDLSDSVQVSHIDYPIHVNAVPYLPPVGTLSCARGSFLVLDALQTVDPDSSPFNITFALTAVPLLHGCIEKWTAGRWGCVTTWTQSDLNTKNIRYTAAPNNTYLGPEIIQFTIKDLIDTHPVPITLNMTIVPAPVVPVNQYVVLSAVTGGKQTSVLSSSNLLVSSTDTGPAALTYTVTGTTLPPGSLFFEVFRAGLWIQVPVNGIFTQDEVNQQFVRVTRTAPAEDIFVWNLTAASPLSQATIGFKVRYHLFPTITTNVPLVVNWYSGADIRNSSLNVSSTSVFNRSAFLYNVTTKPGRGDLSAKVFTQAMLDAGQVRYTHLRDNRPINVTDSFNFTLSDGVGTAINGSFTISFHNVAPSQLYNSTLASYPTSPTRQLTADLLSWSDPDGPQDLSFVLTSVPVGGNLTLNGTMLTPGDGWTYTNMNSLFAASGLATQSLQPLSLTFTYMVLDGLNAPVPGFSNITFIPPLILPTVPKVILCDTARKDINVFSCFIDKQYTKAVSWFPPGSITWKVPPYSWTMYWFDTSYSMLSGSYSQNSVAAGLIMQRYQAGLTGKTETFQLEVTDNLNPSQWISYVFQYQSRPYVQNNEVTFGYAAKGGLIPTSALSWLDLDNTTDTLAFTLLSQPSEGVVESYDNATGSWVTATNWTMADVGRNWLRVRLPSTYPSPTPPTFNFTYQITDGIWTVPAAPFMIYIDDMPRVTVNQTLAVNWGQIDQWTPISSQYLYVADNNQLSLITVVVSPRVGSLAYSMFSWQGRTSTPIYNATYCTCNFSMPCTAPVSPCRYTFSVADLMMSDRANQVQYRSVDVGSGLDGFDYMVSDAHNVVGPFHFGIQLYGKYQFRNDIDPAGVHIVTPFNKSAVVSSAALYAYVPKGELTGQTVTYRLKYDLPTYDLGFALELQRIGPDGLTTVWSSVMLASTVWTQDDINDGNLKTGTTLGKACSS
ncbi:uncharacterized protein EV422DRAFT_235488 [Fimicolochytrium jonesii]|uniref:uncharacterized protein n=1 Tax=Fimicolochytrium jonesii TaxID=1396493 RepID=UPI0022FDCD52|nr:uncharacterized protein EV422DRAFT_235488 [Fimicolochytrium jonesii]KAI8824851.1 hypothetical protein EV422DRAFT_235488 [Fimicolochytrium jonesii]